VATGLALYLVCCGLGLSFTCVHPRAPLLRNTHLLQPHLLSCQASRQPIPPAGQPLPAQRVEQLSRRTASTLPVPGWLAASSPLVLADPAFARRPEGVNKPELLPKTDGDITPIIDVAKILTSGQKRQIEKQISELQEAKKIRLRVLCQTFPLSPGLAIKDYWKVDDRTIVYVHDTGGLGPGAVVNFSVGKEVEAMKPFSYWRQVQNRYQTVDFLNKNGDSDAVVAVVNELYNNFMPEPPRA